MLYNTPMKLTQKDFLKGDRIIEIKETTVKFTFQRFFSRNSYEVPIKNLRRETSEQTRLPVGTLLVTVVLAVIGVALLVGAVVLLHSTSASPAPLFLGALVALCLSTVMLNRFFKSCIDFVIFHDQAGNPAIFLYRTNPNEKAVEDICSEIRKRIENPTGRSGVFQ